MAAKINFHLSCVIASYSRISPKQYCRTIVLLKIEYFASDLTLTMKKRLKSNSDMGHKWAKLKRSQ